MSIGSKTRIESLAMASAVRLSLASMIPVPGPFREGRVARAGFGFAAHRSLDRIGGAGGGTRTPTGDARRIFLPATAFAAAPKGAFGVWTIPSPCSAGAEGRCCPSSLYTFPLPGLARDCHFTGFPEFEQFYVAGFPARTQVWLSPLRLPIPPRPQAVFPYSRRWIRRQG